MNFLEKILSDVPRDFNDLEKARFLYVSLAKYFNFSTKLQNTSNSEFANMYTKKIDIDKKNTNQIICKEWAPIYSILLKKVGIDNKIINQGHEYVLFNYNNKIWCADATSGSYTDLARIKYGDETKYFGVSISQDIDNPKPFINSSDEQMKLLKEIDEKISFYKMKKDKFNKMKEYLLNINKKNLTTAQKLDIILKTVGVLSDGYYESKEYIRELECSILSDEELEDIHAVELKRTNKNLEVDIVQCIYVKDENSFSYYLLAPNLPLTKASSKQILELASLGYGIEDKSIAGISFPKKFKPGVVSNKSFLYRINKNSVSDVIIQFDQEQIGKISR